MDPFEVRAAQAGFSHATDRPYTLPAQVRVQFVTLASRLGSSVASISKVAAFALKHAAKCADDIWDCYLDEVAAANLNSRVNLLYLLDALLDKEGPRAAHNAPPSTKGVHTSYRELVERDLANVVRLVVPDSREGVLNWMATSQVRAALCALPTAPQSAHAAPLQVLRSWKTRRLLDADILDQVSTELEDRKAACVLLPCVPPPASRYLPLGVPQTARRLFRLVRLRQLLSQRHIATDRGRPRTSPCLPHLHSSA